MRRHPASYWLLVAGSVAAFIAAHYDPDPIIRAIYGSAGLILAALSLIADEISKWRRL